MAFNYWAAAREARCYGGDRLLTVTRESANSNVPASFTPTYVIRCAIGEGQRTCFEALTTAFRIEVNGGGVRGTQMGEARAVRAIMERIDRQEFRPPGVFRLLITKRKGKPRRASAKLRRGSDHWSFAGRPGAAKMILPFSASWLAGRRNLRPLVSERGGKLREGGHQGNASRQRRVRCQEEPLSLPNGLLMQWFR